MSVIKAHRWKALQLVMLNLPDDPIEQLINFHNSEAMNLNWPHDDVLVPPLNVSNYKVSRILVDNKSSVNVLFLSTLGEMETEKSSTVFMGFN